MTHFSLKLMSLPEHSIDETAPPTAAFLERQMKIFVQCKAGMY